MNTKTVANELRLTHWAQVMQERGEQGVSVRDYCKATDIKEHVFYYWQRKLRELACQSLIANQNKTASHITEKITTPIVPTGWAVCEASKPNEPTQQLIIEVNGCRIQVDTGVDTTLLSKVCQVLKALC